MTALCYIDRNAEGIRSLRAYGWYSLIFYENLRNLRILHSKRSRFENFKAYFALNLFVD